MPTYDDMRRLIQLANVLHATPAPGRARRLADGLVTLVEATAVGVYVSGDAAEGAGPLRLLAFVTAGRGAARADPEPPPVGPGGPVHEVLAVPPTRTSPAGIVSVYRTGGRVSALAGWRARAFDARHAMLLRLLHPEAAWIFDQAFARGGLPAASDAVLDLMLTGLREKEIAKRLGRSVHTVHSHVKRIYRHYAVGSRAELIARLFARPAASDNPRD